MAIIRITKKQIDEANKAREAALLKDHDFRVFVEQRQRVRLEPTVDRDEEPRSKERPS